MQTVLQAIYLARHSLTIFDYLICNVKYHVCDSGTPVCSFRVTLTVQNSNIIVIINNSYYIILIARRTMNFYC